jgi:hypothetical protein
VNLEPPSGSRISVTTEGAHPLIVVPHRSGSLMRYFLGLFFLACLGFWVVSFGREVSRLPFGEAPREAQAFFVFWIMAWLLGAAATAYLAYRSFRPSVPESLRLMPNGVTYDAGIPPLQGYLGLASPKDTWKSLFPKRTRLELDRGRLQSLRLRETNDGNRLTVDADAQRLDIASTASEIEREWMYTVLADRYSLPLAQRR